MKNQHSLIRAVSIGVLLLGATASSTFGSVVLLSNLPSDLNPRSGASFPNTLRKNGVSFSVGETAFMIDSVQFGLRTNTNTSVTFAVELFSVGASQTLPANGASPLMSEDFTVNLTSTPTVYEFTPSDVWLLDAGERYAIALTALNGASVFMQWSQTNPAMTATGNRGLSVLTGPYSLDGGESWSSSGFTYGFELSGTAVPEPSTYAAVFGFAVLVFAAVRRRRRASV